MGETLFFAGYVLSYVAAWWLPGIFVARHFRRQRAIMGRCNALYIAATKALEHGNASEAVRLVSIIRRREARWNLGNSLLIRTAVTVTALATGFMGFMVVRTALVDVGAAISRNVPVQVLIKETLTEPFLLIIFSGFALIHALLGLSMCEWKDGWQVSDLADRLSRLIDSPRGIIVSENVESEQTPDLDGLSAHQVFGLPTFYTRRDIDRARRRLASTLHPDRWATANPAVRRSKEAAMKRVNQAYDELIKG